VSIATFQTLSPGNIGRTVSIVDEAAGKMHAIARPTAVKARNANGMDFLPADSDSQYAIIIRRRGGNRRAPRQTGLTAPG
jgi:hypothetical protein